MSSRTSFSPDDMAFLSEAGEIGTLIRQRNWSPTSLGPPVAWSQSIKSAVSLCLTSRFPIILWLGPELRIFYNEAYAPLLGERKHPAMLGAPGREAWGEIWDTIGPLLEEAKAGRATWSEDLQFFIARGLPDEEIYVTFSYSPILNADLGTVEGVFCACTETTGRVVGERRLSTLRDLGVRKFEQHTIEAACQHAIEVLEANPLDVAFAALYLVDGDGRSARCAGRTRMLPDNAAAFPANHALSVNDAPHPWPLADAGRSGKPVEVQDLPGRLGAFKAPLWPDFVQTAIVLPLQAPGQATSTGFLVVGISPRRVLDSDYRSFLDLVAEHIGSAIAEVRTFEAERRRAESLAELDRAKTTFFSNVSHEFRTPLTLMLGPLEELLAKSPDDLQADARALATIAHRNGLRLLRLVNTLLDFARIEAGRAQACYEPTDLARLTADLASGFRSVCGRAGLQFEIACPVLPEPVYVDRDMWEKIVLNLLSNAFKFTFDGGIRVSLTATADGAELQIADTGVGVPASEQQRLFERFHRIEGQKSRSHEGSGIGLALVQELVHLNGGRIAVESEVERGTTFSIMVPFGSGHLPSERIGGSRMLPPTSTRAVAYVEEAFRWLPEEKRGDAPQLDIEVLEADASAAPQARILVADDNADVRDYLTRLLSGHGWAVEAVADGVAALDAARHRRPDLVLADVMMPRLDGLALAARLRAQPQLADIPVLLVSARAGEEARVQGVESGADDYLVKPFAARELIARVSTHLALSRLRHDAAERVRRSEARLQAAINLVGLCPYSWDPVTDALDWDDRLRAIWGLPPGAHVDVEIFFSGVHPEDRARVSAAVERSKDPASGGIYALEYRVIGLEDGVERWVATFGRTSFEEGRAAGFVGVALDITDRKRAEERLRVSEERFRRFAQHATDVLWIVDVIAMQVEYLSPAFERVWASPLETIVGRGWERWLETVFPDDRERALELFTCADAGEGATVQYRVVRPDGTMRWIRDTSFPIRGETGRVLWVGGIAQDLTRHDHSLVYVVDGDDGSREDLTRVLHGVGYTVKGFAGARSFLEVVPVLVPGCLMLDLHALDMPGLAVLRELKARNIALPVIVIGAGGDITTVVQAMKAGAVDWLGVPHDASAIKTAVASALAGIQREEERDRTAALARARIAAMSAREREVLAGMMVGDTNKTIARRLGISPRTVEIHRARVMERLGARTLSEAVLLASAGGLTADVKPESDPDTA